MTIFLFSPFPFIPFYYTVAYRGVVFIRHQPNLTPALMSRLATKLGELSGKPTLSKLHIHPLSKEFSELGEFQGEKIDSEADSNGRQISFKSEKSIFASAGWVSFFFIFLSTSLLHFTSLCSLTSSQTLLTFFVILSLIISFLTAHGYLLRTSSSRLLHASTTYYSQMWW